MNWPAIIDALKNLTGVRFYFIVTLMFLLVAGNMFKDTISVAVKDVTFSRVEFRECRDLKGLEIALLAFTNKHSIVNSFTVYIYQPKDRSYYKRVLITNDDIVKSTTTLQGFYLEDQLTISKVFETESYLLVGEGTDEPDIKIMKELGFQHLLIYRLKYKSVIGEIHINLKTKPTPQELEDLLKGLSPLMYIYIV